MDVEKILATPPLRVGPHTPMTLEEFIGGRDSINIEIAVQFESFKAPRDVDVGAHSQLYISVESKITYIADDHASTRHGSIPLTLKIKVWGDRAEWSNGNTHITFRR